MSQLLSKHNYYRTVAVTQQPWDNYYPENQFRPYRLSLPMIPLNPYYQPYPQLSPLFNVTPYSFPMPYHVGSASDTANLNIILIAILILVALDLIFVRPSKIQAARAHPCRDSRARV